MFSPPVAWPLVGGYKAPGYRGGVNDYILGDTAVKPQGNFDRAIFFADGAERGAIG